MARIDLVGPDAATPEIRAVYDVLAERFQKVPNLFATIAHHPPALVPVLQLFDALYEQTDLPDRLKELVLVKVAFGLQSHYCLTLHKAFALDKGVTNDEIKALKDDPELAMFPAEERVVLRYADAYARDPREITDEMHQALRAHYDDEQVVTICLLISLALLFGDVANALHVPIDAIISRPA